jgi:4-amino-4-deoxy-L-arabinose transferase-like glycosyltransferase
VIASLALLLTVLNSLKPMQVDDTAYYFFAKQIAHHPLDPYGFEIFWYSRPQAALEVLAPPVVPYWSSLAIRLFGERPMLWKLWLLPFSLLFAASSYLLLRRFAPGMENILTAMTVLSPSFLPSLNLMLDVPALSLGLCALSLFFAACDNSRAGMALLAGLVAGLAMQTKYTAALAPVAIVLYALFVRRVGLALIALFAAAGLFAGWEWWIASRYGESHFLFHFRHNPTEALDRLQLAFPLLEIVGALGPAFGLFGMFALGMRSKTIAKLGAIALFGYFLITIVPEQYAGFRWHVGRFSGRVSVNGTVFVMFGTAVGLTTLAGAWRLCRLSRGPGRRRASWRRYRLEFFLLLWLVLEIVGYFVLTPFPAARRTLGVAVAGVLIGGRLASRTCRSGARRNVLRAIALGGIGLGACFYAIDFRDAWAQKLAVDKAAQLVQRDIGDQQSAVRHDRGGGNNRVWYVGHWGFQYYAERAGMQAVVPGETMLHEGDWLIIPSRFIDQQDITMNEELLRLIDTLIIEDWLPVRTVPCFYGGHAPLERYDGARLKVRVVRAQREFVATPTN